MELLHALNVGDSFVWQVQYDPDKIFSSAGDEWLMLGSDLSMRIDGTIGTFLFDEMICFWGTLSPGSPFHWWSLGRIFHDVCSFDDPYKNTMMENMYACINATNDDAIYTGTFPWKFSHFASRHCRLSCFQEDFKQEIGLRR